MLTLKQESMGAFCSAIILLLNPFSNIIPMKINHRKYRYITSLSIYPVVKYSKDQEGPILSVELEFILIEV